MNFDQVESEVKKLSKKIKKESFVYDFLLAYGTPKATITMLKNGSRNLSKKENEVVCKKKIFFSSTNNDIEENFKELIADKTTFKHDPRFVVMTDYEKLFALDTKLMEKIDFELKDIHKKFDFFLPLAGIEKKEFQHENPVDVKAAEKLAKLFDLIKADNPKSDEKSLHSLNVFLTRLLFCYFAEDTDIFPSSLFTQNLASHTQIDGSDLSDYLKKLYAIMNVEVRPKELPDYISAFPYVNGGLFAETHPIPKFTKKSRATLLEIGELDWAEINPDIFGSMIQAVVHPNQRAGLGMHYTSVNNIMKVIEPLFLNDLYDELEKNKKNTNKLKKMLKRLSEIKIFDPACGSGNFLIIAYKELRKLEMEIYKYLPGEMKFSYIPLSNFYGIEIDDFAHEVAILSLWLAEHQMDLLFTEEFGEVKASLPLKDGGNIVCGNALRLSWEEVCPNDDGVEVYLLGNPPYLGGKLQSKEQKEDVKIVFEGFKKYNNIDYIGGWFVKASKYINNTSRAAFVSTNSITQGTQVYDLWPGVFENNVEIYFAHKDFPWTNNAKNNAKVMCSIIGITKSFKKDKFIYSENLKIKVKNINGYLVDAPNIFVEKRTKPLSKLPKMIQGNISLDDGHLQLNKAEMESLINDFPKAKKFVKKIMGSRELIQSGERYCLWIKDEDLDLALSIPPLAERIDKVRCFRKKGATNAQACADRPHSFCMVNTASDTQIILPRVSSEKREYIPIGFFSKDIIVSDAAQVILDAKPYLFSLINSKMHMLWVRTFAGKLEMRYRYSAGVCWYSFPFPDITEDQENELTKSAYEILSAREKNSELTLSDLYDSSSMPNDLRTAHNKNDMLIDSLYQNKKFNNDSERLSVLLALYKKMKGEK